MYKGSSFEQPAASHYIQTWNPVVVLTVVSSNKPEFEILAHKLITVKTTILPHIFQVPIATKNKKMVRGKKIHTSHM